MPTWALGESFGLQFGWRKCWQPPCLLHAVLDLLGKPETHSKGPCSPELIPHLLHSACSFLAQLFPDSWPVGTPGRLLQGLPGLMGLALPS